MTKAGRRPKASVPARAHRRPKTEQEPPSTAKLSPLFCFAHADASCDPRWAFDPDGDDARLILKFLHEMGKLSWAQIEAMRANGRPKHHSQDVETLAEKARRDFQRAHLGERFGDEMFRFRLSGERRLWGFRRERTFHVVWWDRNHRVYPTDPS